MTLDCFLVVSLRLTPGPHMSGGSPSPCRHHSKYILYSFHFSNPIKYLQHNHCQKMTIENWVNTPLWEFLLDQSEGQSNYFQWFGGWQKVYPSILSFNYWRLGSLNAKPIEYRVSSMDRVCIYQWFWPGEPVLLCHSPLCTQINPSFSFSSIFYKIIPQMALFYYKCSTWLFYKKIHCWTMHSSNLSLLVPLPQLRYFW